MPLFSDSTFPRASGGGQQSLDFELPISSKDAILRTLLTGCPSPTVLFTPKHSFYCKIRESPGHQFPIQRTPEKPQADSECREHHKEPQDKCVSTALSRYHSMTLPFRRVLLPRSSNTLKSEQLRVMLPASLGETCRNTGDYRSDLTT